MIPLKTTIDDLDKLLGYLRPVFGWTALAKVKAALDSKTTDNRKLEAAKYLGLINRDGVNIEITDAGRAYASTQDPAERATVMARQLASSELYRQTVEWMYHSNKSEPTKTDVGEQWHKHYTPLLEGAQGAALTDGVIVFMRVAEAAGLGKFITAGKNRPETKFKGERPAIEEFYSRYVLGQDTGLDDEAAPVDSNNGGSPAPIQHVTPALPALPAAPTTTQAAAPATPQVTVQASPAVHINVEIHIAADATAETVAEIFKNMRKYVLNNPDESAEAGE